MLYGDLLTVALFWDNNLSLLTCIAMLLGHDINKMQKGNPHYPYIRLLESCGFKLSNFYENGGVHFDNFHSPYHWRKYGEVRINSLERRNIYNFIKI